MKKQIQKRQLTDAEVKKIRKYQQSFASHLYSLINNDNIATESKSILRSMHNDVKSAVSKSNKFNYLT
jgi:hypothetical protein